MELQEDSLERKRFIICYLSYYSSIDSVYYSLKFIFVIVWAAKIGNFRERVRGLFDKGYCKGIVPLFILHPFEYHL